MKQIPNYIANKILKAVDLINQWQSQSQDTILGYDGTTRNPLAEFNIGDLTAIINGALVNDILMRVGGTLKEYNSAGALQNSQTIAQILRASLALNTDYIEGFDLANKVANPDEQIDVQAGKCLAKDKITVLELTSLTVANLTSHITPANSTTYHLYIYKHSGTGVILLDFSTSLTPTAGSGVGQLPNLDGTKYRRIASFKTDTSGDFYELRGKNINGGGLKIEYEDLIDELSASNPATSTDTLLTLKSIPLGVQFEVEILGLASTNVGVGDSISANFGSVYQNQPNRDAGGHKFNDLYCIGDAKRSASLVKNILTNLSSQIKYSIYTSTTTRALYFRGASFVDFRNND